MVGVRTIPDSLCVTIHDKQDRLQLETVIWGQSSVSLVKNLRMNPLDRNRMTKGGT